MRIALFYVLVSFASWAWASAQSPEDRLSGPRERDFVVVTFDQDYRSDGLSNVMRKRQYWVKEGAQRKIIYEGSG